MKKIILIIFLLPTLFFGQNIDQLKGKKLNDLNDTELIQYLLFVGFGPSSNTWPRWAPHLLQVTSIRDIPWDLSSMSFKFFESVISKKLGHPE